jgi:hypothetical protein
MLQVRTSPVRFPMSSLNCFNLPNPYSRIIGLGFTQPLTETSTRNIPGDKARQVRKDDDLSPSTNLVYRKRGILDVSEANGALRSVTELALLFYC